MAFVNKSQQFTSVNQLKENLYQRTLLDTIFYYCFYSWYYKLKILPKRIYWFFQRGKRGYADCDTWDFDNYLTNVILGGLKNLKKHSHSAKPTEKEFDIMIEGFEANLIMMDDPMLYDELKPIFDKGMKLFHKYFNYFWD